MRNVAVMRVVVGGMVGVAVLAGCSGNEGGGSGATTSANAAGDNLFNPCRGAMSDAALREAGLDPATLHVVTDPPTGASAWRVCTWRPLDDRYGSGRRTIGIASTRFTLDDLRKKEDATVLRATTVNSRPGLVSQQNRDVDSCYVSFSAEQGMFEIRSSWLSTEGPRVGDLCTMAQQYAEALEPDLPK
ncbi:hypothetical protein NN3_42270 [Nocardia neocaledoniensis NBRC 108232]|uniref:Uncharacterized protein DUF3558 n=1 Tax=Nocardia neocaledoniensis TaxID=236511 RepID=A0A317NVX0_9NOCA|nr:DUF3558 domain-containing protein [Nocardia neocaledoniensis]PWV79449.1 uncharacterized protein DUF3558 [Nocardia neocaledoniensis]GEM33220.1 hypothetical protein NN3_42270 [Nocardia neocaledoniensis NBRC 108232]